MDLYPWRPPIFARQIQTWKFDAHAFTKIHVAGITRKLCHSALPVHLDPNVNKQESILKPEIFKKLKDQEDVVDSWMCAQINEPELDISENLHSQLEY